MHVFIQMGHYDDCPQRRWVRRIDYRAGAAIHAVSGGKHVLARLQYVVQSDIVLVLDHVNPKDLQIKRIYLDETHVKKYEAF